MLREELPSDTHMELCRWSWKCELSGERPSCIAKKSPAESEGGGCSLDLLSACWRSFAKAPGNFGLEITINLETRGCDKSLHIHKGTQRDPMAGGRAQTQPWGYPEAPQRRTISPSNVQKSWGAQGHSAGWGLQLRIPEEQPHYPWPLPELSQQSHLFQGGGVRIVTGSTTLGHLLDQGCFCLGV